MRSAFNTPGGVLFLVLSSILSIHILATIFHERYGQSNAFSSLTSKLISPSSKRISSSFTDSYSPNDQNYTTHRANATFVILCRNDQLWFAVRSVREIEDRFNHIYHYPYVFLNEIPFTDEFKSRLSMIVSGTVEFGLIPRHHWFQPEWIDEDKAEKSRHKMEADNIIYGGSLSYRNMCRFNSGFFFRHPLMLKYKWYWRIEPDVHFHCNINFDPFKFLEDHNKLYAFTISMKEYEATIQTLWGHVMDFVRMHPEYVAPNNAMGFISDGRGNRYNLCHFWSNFEIANMEFWRGEAYTKFFEYLDSQGGFYYERWGDAPVHSIAAAIFASRDQIHFFDEIGYEHAPYTHCPKAGSNWGYGRCSCNPAHNFDFDGISCLKKFQNFMGSW